MSSKNWKTRKKAEKEANNTILKVINKNIIAEMEIKKSPTTIYGPLDYKRLQAKNHQENLFPRSVCSGWI